MLENHLHKLETGRGITFKGRLLLRMTLGVAMASLLAFGSGCQTGPTHKQGFDFSHYHTFVIRPLPTAGTYRDPSVAVRLGPSVRRAVQETLSGKGFQEAAPNEADFQVNLAFDYHPEGEEGRHERRVLKIEIIDTKSNEVVWWNWRHRTTDRTMSAEEVQKVIAEMLKPFPPGVETPATVDH